MSDIDINKLLKDAGVLVPDSIHEVIQRAHDTKSPDVNLTCTVFSSEALGISIYADTQKGSYKLTFGSGWWVAVAVANTRPTASVVNISQAWWNVDPQSQESLAAFEMNLQTIIKNATTPPVYR